MNPGKKKSPDTFVVNDVREPNTETYGEKNDAILFIKRH